MKFSRSALTVAVLVAAAFSASAQNIAIVNGKAVPTARLDVLAQQIAASGRPVDDAVRAQLKEEVVLREVFMQEAQKRGIGTTDEFKNQLELARQTIMIRALFADFQAKNPVTDADIKAEYDKFVAANGGDLDWAAAASYVPEFSEAMVKLEKGQTTQVPVKTQFGWHIIRVDDVRQAELPKMEEVKPQIAQQMQQQKLTEFQKTLREKAKIE